MTIDTADLKAAALACDPSKSADETQHSRRLAEFYDECEPEDILALIAENERLSAQLRLAGVSAEIAVHDMAGRAATDYLVVAQERDKLKAEVEVLTPGFEEIERICKALSWLGISVPSGGEEKAARWVELVRAVVRAAEQSKMLRQDVEGKVLVPIKPTIGLLMSMAIRHDHGLGIPGYYDQAFQLKASNGVTHARRLECAIAEMSKLHEEVVGTGFYSPEKEDGYAAMCKETGHA